jgi:transcriptional regulator with XRE-family HTH domain
MQVKKQQIQQNGDVFSSNLRKARGESTQSDFAKWLGINSQQTYRNYEGGRIPSAPKLGIISKQIGVSVDDLLYGEVPENAMLASELTTKGVDPEIARQLAKSPETIFQSLTANELEEEIDDGYKSFKSKKNDVRYVALSHIVICAEELIKRKTIKRLKEEENNHE